MRTLEAGTEYELGFESDESRRESGRYHRARTLMVRGRTLILGAGYADNVYVFEEQGDLIVLSVNRDLEYAGIEVFDMENDMEDVDDLFIQNEQEIQNVLGHFDLTPMTIAKRMYEFVQQR